MNSTNYDNASWHYSWEDYPESSPLEWGGVHIALFVKWCLQKGWASDFLKEGPNTEEAIEAVVAGTMSATDFFFDHCDGKFFEEELTEEGNQFVRANYDAYTADYVHLSPDGYDMFEHGEEEYDYDALARVLEERYQEFLADPDTTFGRDKKERFGISDEDGDISGEDAGGGSELPSSSSEQNKPWWKFW